MTKEQTTEPILIKAGDTRVLINGHPPLVDCRIVAEEKWLEYASKDESPQKDWKESETGIWLQNQIKYLSRIEGEVVKVSEYGGGLSLRFKDGNSYTLKLSKQCQVTLD